MNPMTRSYRTRTRLKKTGRKEGKRVVKRVKLRKRTRTQLISILMQEIVRIQALYLN